MAGPGDEIAAVWAGRGLLRASHADREQVIDTLKAAFVEGRLTKDEFDARVGQAFASRTCAELAVVTSDIPAGSIGPEPAPNPARARAQRPENTRIKASVSAITAATVPLAGAWMGAWLAHVDNAEIIVLLMSLTVVLFGAWLVTGSVVLQSRQQQSSGGQLPPRSTPGGRSSRRPGSAASAEQLPPSGRGQQHAAEAAPCRRPARRRPPRRHLVDGALAGTWPTLQLADRRV
jgi:hypothetical protein